MSETDDSGSSVRDKLESVHRQTGTLPIELQNLVELPESMQDVWSWFLELHSSRTSSGFGVNPIVYSDIYAFFNLKNIVPLEWEVNVIRRLDGIALGFYAKQSKKTSQKATRKK